MVASPYHFDSSDADVILVATANGEQKEFYAHRCILAAASPFFHDMFTLPQAKSDSEDKPRVVMSDPPNALDGMLRMLYPIPKPTFNLLDELLPVLAVAVKYDLVYVTDVLRRELVTPKFLHASPLRVYAIACRFDLDEEARIASRYTLVQNVIDAPLEEDLKYIDGFSYHRLLKLHSARVSRAQKLLKIPENIKCMQCNGSQYSFHGSPKWWYEYEKRALEELAQRPTTDVIFELEFLFQAASATDCPRCPESVLDSWRFLKDLKQRIDDLPSTV